MKVVIWVWSGFFVPKCLQMLHKQNIHEYTIKLQTTKKNTHGRLIDFKENTNAYHSQFAQFHAGDVT